MDVSVRNFHAANAGTVNMPTRCPGASDYRHSVGGTSAVSVPERKACDSGAVLSWREHGGQRMLVRLSYANMNAIRMRG